MITQTNALIELYKKHGALTLFFAGWAAAVMTVMAIAAQRRPSELLAEFATSVHAPDVARWLLTDGPWLVTTPSAVWQGVAIWVAALCFAVMVGFGLLHGRARPLETAQECLSLMGSPVLPAIWIALLLAVQAGAFPSGQELAAQLPWGWIAGAVLTTCAAYALAVRGGLFQAFRPVADLLCAVLAAIMMSAAVLLVVLATVIPTIVRWLVQRWQPNHVPPDLPLATGAVR